MNNFDSSGRSKKDRFETVDARRAHLIEAALTGCPAVAQQPTAALSKLSASEVARLLREGKMGARRAISVGVNGTQWAPMDDGKFQHWGHITNIGTGDKKSQGLKETVAPQQQLGSVRAPPTCSMKLTSLSTIVTPLRSAPSFPQKHKSTVQTETRGTPKSRAPFGLWWH